MEGEIIKVSHLKGNENWGVWKFQLRIIFISKGVYEIVKGDVKKPTAPTAAAIAANAEVEVTYKKELKEWIKNDGIAQLALQRPSRTHPCFTS